MKKLIIKIIRLYQRMPLNTHKMCVFIPTCSEYMIISINEYGVLKGVYLGIKRILRCHHKKEFTIDMVKQKENKKWKKLLLFY